MENQGIKFYPLYLIYHDQWVNRNFSWSNTNGWSLSGSTLHRGHMHFFMPDYNMNDKTKKGKAYSGKQTYSFSFETLWGPNSKDPNQANNFKYIGSPKWYFEVVEYWRRVYIQPWDDNDKNSLLPNFVGRKGIKYDASNPSLTYGPFREGKNFFFFYDLGARALPIEYFEDYEKTSRYSYLYGNSVAVKGIENGKYVAEETKFFIPENGYVNRPIEYNFGIQPGNEISKETAELWDNKAKEVGAVYNEVSKRYEYTDTFGSFQESFNDLRFIFPIIEYQKVKHLNWERLPGWEERDGSEIGGDGFSISVSVPYEVNNNIQSPFSDDNGEVFPPGIYQHRFDIKNPDSVLRYPLYDKCDIGFYQWRICEKVGDDNVLIETVTAKEQPDDLPEGRFVDGYVVDGNGSPVWGKNPDHSFDEWRTPDEIKGKKVVFNVPSGMVQDGVWVEQCLGGIIRAKARVKIIDNFGEEKEIEVSTTKFFLDEKFEGADQNEPTTN